MELDIEHVLEIGRRFQQSDSNYRGATWETAKLLCDTIESLRDKIKKANKAKKTGYWAYLYCYSALCSACGGEIYTHFELTNEAIDKWDTLYPYCPHCGAKMKYKKPNVRRKKNV